MAKKLLCCTAHPDDECFAFGGALALAARQGYEIHLVCFTAGTAGSYRGTASSDEELAAMRTRELAASCEVLGIRTWEVLNYQDGKLLHANFYDCAGLLVERIRSFRPEIVLTFGPDGALNTHPDHTMVGSFASAAFHWAPRTRPYPADESELFAASRLYHLSADFTLPDREPLLPAPWTVKLDISSVRELKEEAFRRHTTQLPLVEKVKPVWDKLGGYEYYLLAGVPEPMEMVLSDWMF